MRVAVVGAGAIGAYVGACLARGGTETHLVARGANLAAMRADGVEVVGSEGAFRVDVHATDNPREVGIVDAVFLGLKAYSYAEAGDLLAPLLGPDTAVIAAQNGIPWWYFHGHGGPVDGRRLEGAEAVGDHKTSMLQDLEAGKRLELEVLVGAVLEIGALVDVELPRLGAVHAATALLARGR
jgi:2-dehydropantoate 2-reductase